MKRVTVHTFAQLRDYFGPEVSMTLASHEGIGELIRQLQEQKPESALLLANCRFANEEEFIDASYPLQDEAHIYFYPPSSGG